MLTKAFKNLLIEKFSRSVCCHCFMWSGFFSHCTAKNLTILSLYIRRRKKLGSPEISGKIHSVYCTSTSSANKLLSIPMIIMSVLSGHFWCENLLSSLFICSAEKCSGAVKLTGIPLEITFLWLSQGSVWMLLSFLAFMSWLFFEAWIKLFPTVVYVLSHNVMHKFIPDSVDV